MKCFVLLCLLSFASLASTPARTEAVVSPAWVFEAMKGLMDSPQAPRVIIIEASWAKLADAKEYRAGHLPGALHLNTDELEDGAPTWHLRKPRELHRVLGALGITPETTVIVYSHQTIAAARIWWVLLYAGVRDVRLLNGGVTAWQAAGYPVETKINKLTPTRFTGRVNHQWRATTAYVKTHLRNRDKQLADARSHEEFIGAVSGYDYMKMKGRLPGAVAIGDADDAARLYVNADGTLRDPREIMAQWQAAGLVPEKHELIFYCGSGWRSSLTFLYAWLLGFERIRNYSDGWSGWSTVYLRDSRAQGSTPGWRQRRSANPIVSGKP
ncbi:MAG: sulfurtransferase [Acidobacteria bacterium]|nr:sulfurtransferase [Acidobacteriota bacterium]